MDCSSLASFPKRRKIPTATTTMPRGKRTNWKRMERGDSRGMSVMRGTEMQNAECRMQNDSTPTASAFCILHSALASAPRHHDEIRQIRLELRRRIRHHDGVLVTHRLAEPASDALRLLHEGDLVVVGHRLVLRLDHLDALERTDVDAELAPRAQLLDDLGLGDLFRLDARDEVAVLVLDRVDRAVDAADRAVDAALGMDVVLAAGRPPDGVGG